MPTNTVLLVDDDPNLLAALKRNLRREPFRLMTAASGEEALSLMESETIDVVVSDQQMPGMAGTEFLTEVHDRFPNTARVMLTGNATMDVAIQAINEGAISRFLTKPCDPEQLRATLHETLELVQLRRENEKQKTNLERLAILDELTGVLNRRGLMDRLTQEMLRSRRYGSRLCLGIVDLDHFKRVNDTWGHLMGDKVLSLSAGVIEGNCRPSDIVGRYGGEEFCVILTETGLREAAMLAERLRAKLAEIRHMTDSKEIFAVTCSIGMAEFTSEIVNADQFIESADQALYKAKETGRNKVVLAKNQPMPPSE